jgi:hypothetical protein
VVPIRSVTCLDIVPAVCCICHWCVQFKAVDSVPSDCSPVPPMSQPLLCPQVATFVYCAWLGVSSNVILASKIPTQQIRISDCKLFQNALSM